MNTKGTQTDHKNTTFFLAFSRSDRKHSYIKHTAENASFLSDRGRTKVEQKWYRKQPFFILLQAHFTWLIVDREGRIAEEKRKKIRAFKLTICATVLLSFTLSKHCVCHYKHERLHPLLLSVSLSKHCFWTSKTPKAYQTDTGNVQTERDSQRGHTITARKAPFCRQLPSVVMRSWHRKETRLYPASKSVNLFPRHLIPIRPRQRTCARDYGFLIISPFCNLQRASERDISLRLIFRLCEALSL